MGTVWVWNSVVAICLLVVTSVSARMCVLGTEPDESVGGKVRFVLPPGDPCSCTEIVLGGHNSYAAPRQDNHVYIDTLPMNAEGLRRSQGCPQDTSSLQVEAQVVYKDCQEALEKGQSTSGIYTIEPYQNERFNAYCDMKTELGYIVIQRRLDGSVNFNRNWAEYKEGFGDLDGEFWLGNEKIHRITSRSRKYQLFVTLTAFDGTVAQARYDHFSIKEEKSMYEIIPGGFTDSTPDGTSNAGNSLEGKQFTTRDKDNDDDDANCAQALGGGWWFSHCVDAMSNLNGKYYNTPTVERFQGIYWLKWKGDKESLKATEMKIKAEKQ